MNIDHIYDMETPEEKELADKVRNDLESIKSDVNHILHDEIDMNNEDIVPCI
jgi:glucose-6-phosphate-specific signal transduction histidine kinase